MTLSVVKLSVVKLSIVKLSIVNRKAALLVVNQSRRLVSDREHIVGLVWPRFFSVEFFEVA